MDLAAFAAARGDRLREVDDALLPVVQRALADYDPKLAWYAPIVDKAIELGGDSFSTAEAKQLRAALAETKDPSTTSGDTAERTTRWVSTYIVNATEHDGAADSMKTWVTRHDDRVRHVHADLDGTTIPANERFDVGGIAKLRFPGEPVGDPAAWINCRCVLQTTKGNAMSITAAAPAGPGEAQPTANPADQPAEDPNAPTIDQAVEVPFHGTATVTDTPTGDNRQLASTGFQVRPLPLPLFYQRAQGDGHGGSTIVGQMTRVALNDAGDVEYDGFFNFTPEAGEVIQGVAEGWLRGVSVDLDNVIVDVAASTPKISDGMTDAEAQQAIQTTPSVFSQWRVSGLTVVGIPAFHQAYIALGPRAAAGSAEAPQATEAVAASASTEEFAPGTHDGPGWLTHPIPTGRIRRYWVHGEGAAKIQWGVPGDFNRCRTHLGKYIANQDWLAGACANMHKEAIGVWPGQEDGKHAIRQGLLASGAKMAAAFNLVASARELPSAALFANPRLQSPTPITIEGEHIFGHIATWGTCHLGQPGMCTTAPRSNTDYAWFRLGAVETDEGLVPVGQITMGTGHADLRENRGAAAAHYDNTGMAVADIATGEDDWGIWFSGRIRPGLSDETRSALLAAKLSGDWREVRGNLELVAALAVNTPGFGIPRVGLAASAELGQTSLVAAGLVDETAEIPVVDADFDARVRKGVEAYLAAKERRANLSERTARLRVRVAEQRHARVQSARERFGKDV